jgi:hypothetical protein
VPPSPCMIRCMGRAGSTVSAGAGKAQSRALCSSSVADRGDARARRVHGVRPARRGASPIRRGERRGGAMIASPTQAQVAEEKAGACASPRRAEGEYVRAHAVARRKKPPALVRAFPDQRGGARRVTPAGLRCLVGTGARDVAMLRRCRCPRCLMTACMDMDGRRTGRPGESAFECRGSLFSRDDAGSVFFFGKGRFPVPIHMNGNTES